MQISWLGFNGGGWLMVIVSCPRCKEGNQVELFGEWRDALGAVFTGILLCTRCGYRGLMVMQNHEVVFFDPGPAVVEDASP